MTDKEIVERAKDAEKRTGFGELVHSPISSEVNSAYGIGFIEGMVEYRKSLQEEPVSEDFEEALAREWQGYNDRGAATVDALEDNTQELAFAKGFYRGSNWQKQKDSIPVSGDLEEASLEYFKQALKDGDKTKLDAFKAGAQWQKEKEYTCYEEAFEDGAKWKMEQMMNNSVDAYLERDLGGQLIIGKANSPAGDEFMLLNSYSFPEIKCGKKCKVKLVIIKKDLL